MTYSYNSGSDINKIDMKWMLVCASLHKYQSDLGGEKTISKINNDTNIWVQKPINPKLSGGKINMLP